MRSPLEISSHNPPLRRFSMVYKPLVQPSLSNKFKLTLLWRRLLLLLLVLGSTWKAVAMMVIVFGPSPIGWLKSMIIGIFAVLFSWISITFWTAVIGFIRLLFKRKSYPAQLLDNQHLAIKATTRVAVVMPIYNEDVRRVFACIEVMYASLKKTGKLDHFSFFVLSDTNQADCLLQEQKAWHNLCRRIGSSPKIFYRHRKVRIRKKSGNISDFCRRWGTQYDYMITLDADSLMSGDLLVDMVKIMDAQQDIGILQTVPKGINQQSLVSRINQFASYLYAPVLLAGSSFVELNDASFWGHNAIIRLEPFMKFCALPKLPGALPFGGEILSHDFVEAALMRRAGWGVWLAYELEGSYEELPPSLIEELERDCRWCRGNLQHLRLMLMQGVSSGHRFLFVHGNMFYCSSLLWLSLLVLMTIHAISEFFYRREYFPEPGQLFPNWPVRYDQLSMELLLFTAVFLFFPKVLGVIWAIIARRTHLFGGFFRLWLSVALEILVSIFLAPIRMLYHSWFVVTSLVGGRFDWKKQIRHLKQASLLESLKAYGAGSLIAGMWAWLAFEIDQTLFWWMSVILIPLLLSVPFTMMIGSLKAGIFFKHHGFFLTPMEILPSSEIRHLNDVTR